MFTEHDIYLFKQGRHFRLYQHLGAQVLMHGGVRGTYFAVWAPNAQAVSVIGDFNYWSPGSHKLNPRSDGSGIWEGFVAQAMPGQTYKYHIESRFHGYRADKGDPFAFFWETSPNTASRIWKMDYDWSDSQWMNTRGQKSGLEKPMSIYEMHLGSWKRDPSDASRFLTYGEIARDLPGYLKEMGYTHVEFMPVFEHPFYGSWGYQCLGFFSPTSRFGTPQDFMALIDALHQHDIGVILDWVPSHFPTDEYGLGYFDGTHLYEHQDPRKGFHPDWKSFIFNYDRHEVVNFLISSAMFWLDKYHIDGLRLDAVASMLYLDYSRQNGEWIPNEFGGNENIGAIDFLKLLNTTIYQNYPDVQTFAEESTSWPMVSRPTYVGGLGFGYKWNMGWMNDTLNYMEKDPVYRKYHHNKMTFSIWYAYSENFVLPLSHDEVVHGKGSLINKMPGDDWNKFSGLRLLLGYMYAHPGKKMTFMGSEFAQWTEWNHDKSLDWHLLEYENHQQMLKWMKTLNHFYQQHPQLYELDFSNKGFSWIDCHDADNSTLSFLRMGRDDKPLLVAANFTPVPRLKHRLGVPFLGSWKEILNSDNPDFGGSGVTNSDIIESHPHNSHGYSCSLELSLPPMAIIFLEVVS
ncbi:1,4-alpha-glucan branching protein GlgB [Desulfonatronovibrio magnus]|uniref:1,4-alpha-glucan branching protein GlgB n=1 Tax=Desulfonatronovibrio magnus TaxID=698827 RepID=UPI0005EB8C78|nr:1,4-alpha-glucan branching protein GlgB [Desulfonatronovibrio magnus]